MPRAPKRACAKCHRATERSPCDSCAGKVRKIVDRKRGTAAQRGYGARWRRARAAFLREHPLCECADCKREGRLLEATVVDHITPHRGDETLFWNPDNWMAMSASCHSRKTATRDGGGWRAH